MSFQISIFVEHNISYPPYKSQLARTPGSNFTEGRGWKTRSGTKKPSAFRVKIGAVSSSFIPTWQEYLARILLLTEKGWI